jgi:hypothetical protein
VAEHVSHVLLAPEFSSLQKMGHTPNFVCHPVKSETLMFVAAQQWELLETQNNQISNLEKQDAHVGRADAQPSVALL